MGRPHVAIAVLGLGSCLALALVMKTALNMSSDKEIPQAVVEIREQFGRQLAGPPSYYVEDTLQGPFGYLLVKPLLNSGAPAQTRCDCSDYNFNPVNSRTRPAMAGSTGRRSIELAP